MAMATLQPPTLPRLPLLRSLHRPSGGATTAEGHLHFDRNARVWRGHQEREARTALIEVAECA